MEPYFQSIVEKQSKDPLVQLFGLFYVLTALMIYHIRYLSQENKYSLILFNPVYLKLFIPQKKCF